MSLFNKYKTKIAFCTLAISNSVSAATITLADGEQRTISANNIEAGSSVQIRSNTTLTINKGITVQSTGGDAIQAIAGGSDADTTIINNGAIISTANAVDFTNLGNNTINFVNAGSITGNIQGETGRDLTLTLKAGSSITGNIETNEPNSFLEIDGDGTLSGNTFSNFGFVNLNAGTYNLANGARVECDTDLDLTVASEATLSIDGGSVLRGKDTTSTFDINGTVIVNDGTLGDRETGVGISDRHDQIIINNGGVLQLNGNNSYAVSKGDNFNINSGGKLILNGGNIITQLREIQALGPNAEIQLLADSTIFNSETGDFLFNVAGAIFSVSLSGGSTAPKLIQDEGNNGGDFSNCTIKVNANGYYVADGASMPIFVAGDGGNTVLNIAGVTVESSIPTVNFTAVNIGNDLYLNATRVPFTTGFAEEASKNPESKKFINKIESIILGKGNNIADEFFPKIESLNSNQLKTFLESITPVANDASNISMLQSSNMHMDSIFGRIASNTHYQTTYVAGDKYYDDFVPWYQVTYNSGVKLEYKGTPGYNLSAGNLTIGLDKTLQNAKMFGFSFGFTKAGYNMQTLYRNRTDFNGYQFSLYGSSNVYGFYVNGACMFSKNHFNNKREEYVQNIYHAYESEYEGGQYGFEIHAEHPFMYDEHHVLPIVGISYQRSEKNSYNEALVNITNTGLPKRYASSYDESFIGKLGVNYIPKDFSIKMDVLIKPSLNINIAYDFLGKRPEVVSNFINDATIFKTIGPKPKRISTMYGLNLEIIRLNRWNLNFNYTHERQKKYYGNTVNLRFKYTY